jgi:hypothetical protein
VPVGYADGRDMTGTGSPSTASRPVGNDLHGCAGRRLDTELPIGTGDAGRRRDLIEEHARVAHHRYEITGLNTGSGRARRSRSMDERPVRSLSNEDA